MWIAVFAIMLQSELSTYLENINKIDRGAFLGLRDLHFKGLRWDGALLLPVSGCGGHRHPRALGCVLLRVRVKCVKRVLLNVG